MKKKNGIIITTIVVLLLLVVGVTYAFFTYESGTKSDIVTGQIYMNYEETSTISLTGVFPETKEQALARNDENGVFEFTITGRNTSKYPVYYEIDLLEGGVMTGKTETSTKILPEHVRIYLERDGEPLVDGVTFKDWNNRRIYVDTVPANQTGNIEHKYTLRMWIDESVTISDTDPNADYTTTEWNDAYTSLKVRVVGDFEYKDVSTDASCFAYNVVEVVDEVILDTSEEKVEACMTSLAGMGEDVSTAQDGYQSFCEGTGTYEDPEFGTMTLQEFAVSALYQGFTMEELKQMLPVIVEGEEFDVIEITNYDEETCGTDVIIPSTIEDLPVTRIADERSGTPATQINAKSNNLKNNALYNELKLYNVNPIDVSYNGVFANKGITSVKFPNTLKYIGVGSFGGNEIKSVIIPDSVTEIGDYAFRSNDITNVEIGIGITRIGDDAFNWNPLVTVNIKNNPSLGQNSFSASYPDDFVSPIGAIAPVTHFKIFQYNGTCEELNQYTNVFDIDYAMPQQIITSDTNSCTYTGPTTVQ